MNIWLAEIWRSWRASFRRPGFLLLASLVLALGVGASVAVVTLIQNTLWRPLPVPHASRLVMIGPMNDRGQARAISPHEFQYLGKLDVASLGLERPGTSVNVSGAGAPVLAPMIEMDRRILPTLGLKPVLGRNFDVHEDSPHGPAVVMLGYGFWQRAFAGDTHVVGRRLKIEGMTHTIVGVLPKAFNTVLGPADVILPMALPAVSHDYNHNGHIAIARLAKGVGVATVSAEADAHERTMFRDMGMGGNWTHPRFRAESFVAAMRQNTRPTLLLFLVCAGLVLLIVLVNLTNLMWLRSLTRHHDLAVRSALGAPMLRLMLPALGEGLLVGACGALLGMGLAVAGLTLAQEFIPTDWLWGGSLHVRASAWAMAFVIGLLGALLAAGLSLWRNQRVSAVSDLREGGRSGLDRRSGWLGQVLVVAQVALAAILLSAAGMFVHALMATSQVHLGFNDAHILTFDLAPVKSDYSDAAAVRALSRRLVQRLRTMPGITDAAVMTNLPTSDSPFGQLNNGVLAPDGKELQVQYHGVGPGYFRLFDMHERTGRGFTREDRRGSERVGIVSRDLADALYDGHALGKLIHVEGLGSSTWPVRIVGVVDETYQFGPLQPRQPVLYVPLGQVPAQIMTIFRHLEPFRFALRGHGNPMAWRAEVRQAVTEIAPEQPIAHFRSMRDIVQKTTHNARLSLWLIGLFAALALMLAAAGLYAVMAVAVTAREREFGVRMALGAAPSRLLRLVMRGGLVQIGIGLVIGVGVTLALSRVSSAWLMNLLGHSGAMDPLAIAGVCVLLAMAGLLACLLPALRAARVQPMHALRGE